MDSGDCRMAMLIDHQSPLPSASCGRVRLAPLPLTYLALREVPGCRFVLRYRPPTDHDKPPTCCLLSHDKENRSGR